MIDFLVVGLGNPGEEYANTPHNLGFLVVDRLAELHAIRVSRKEDMSRVGLGSIGARQVALAKPQTYMNLSGSAVRGLLERYEIGPDRLLVVYDELDLPWGSLKIRPEGSAAGHNGVKSLIASLGTMKFARVRMGIDLPGRDRSAGEGKKFVLGRFSRARKQEVEEAVALGARAVESILAEGVEKSMAVFNRRAQGLQEEEE
ncbi:MAG TPA: aminoacyl-tRNA hydrolase [Bryobacteraceae bacterium]|jgi:PTH1 family peptidyl-tRNA hydrolase